MRDLLLGLIHLLAIIARSLGPGHVRGLVAEKLLFEAAVARAQPELTAGTESNFD